MAWSYNGTRIYVQGQDVNAEQIVARLQPLGATTVIQVFGDSAPIYKVDAIVVGNANLQALFDLLNDGTAYNLVGNDFSSLALTLSKLSAKRRSLLSQTIDTTQDCYAPVFDISMELMK